MHEVPILIQNMKINRIKMIKMLKTESFHRLKIVFLRFQFRNLKLASRRR